MRRNPKDWRIEQLLTVARAFGVEVRRPGGSHVTLSHPERPDILTVPARRPIKPIYVRRFVEFIDRLENGGQ